MTTGLVVMAYGTPASPDDVEAYYTHIRRGRPPTREQLDELVGRYQAIGGVSPLTERTRAQVDALATALEDAEPGEWRVELGNKHTTPFVESALTALADRGAPGGRPDRVIGLVLAPHYSRGSVGEYHKRAAAAAAEHGLTYTPVDSWHHVPAWVDAQARRVREALAELPDKTKVLFTAHSLPERVLEGDPYPDELLASATAVADELALPTWSTAWQSAGATPEPWRGPDILDIIRELAGTGRADGILVVPQGFTSDHLEVVYDLDIEAAAVATDAGLAFARTDVVNDDPTVMAALADRLRALVA
jgi:protoporphyrin/coproporphyrin ferrochelatase